MRRQPKSQAIAQVLATSAAGTAEISTQTTVSLDHCVRSITWIPMPDDVHPMHEVCDEEDSEADEYDDTGVNGIDTLNYDPEILPEMKRQNIGRGDEQLGNPSPISKIGTPCEKCERAGQDTS